MIGSALDSRRRRTLRDVVATFAPLDARIDRITEYAAAAIESLTPCRRAELQRLLDLLWLPMRSPDAIRARALAAMANAPLAQLRTGFAALKRLSLFLAYAESEHGDSNPTWSRIGYPGPRSDATGGGRSLRLAVARSRECVRADVVVIGSGAGGAVAASAFARAGMRVIVLEAGGAYETGDFNQREISMSELYLDRGLTASHDLGIAILAGSTLGGGTTVNWCTCLRLPDRIAHEWGRQSGIPELGEELVPHYAAVEDRLDLSPAATHNANNRALLEGARALGMRASLTPRNAARDCGDGCGYCGYGCAYGKKRSAAAVFLPDVTDNGGAIYANARAMHVEVRNGRARAVVAEQLSDSARSEFTIDAGLVVLAAGALRTPGLLARSGVSHPQLGRRLFLHPVASAIAEFDHHVEPWSGPMQSVYCDALSDRSGNYGVTLEAAPAHPGLAALALPWQNRERHADLMGRLPRVATMIALTRDRDPGAIGLDGEATVRYRLSRHDGANLLAGLVALVDVAFAGGAARVMTLHAKPLEIERAAWTPRRRDEFARQVRSIGTAPNRQTIFSAHQMGTAAMGADPNHSVVDPAGRVRCCSNLLVADASTFPQSSGVNPMLTIMAMASRIAVLNGGRIT